MQNIFLNVILPLIAVMVFVPFTDGYVDRCWNVHKNNKYIGGTIHASYRINTTELCRAYCAYLKNCWIIDYDKKNEIRPCYLVAKFTYNRDLISPERGRSTYWDHRPCIVKQILVGRRYRQYLDIIADEMRTRNVNRDNDFQEDGKLLKYYEETKDTIKADPELRIKAELDKAKESLDYSYEDD